MISNQLLSYDTVYSRTCVPTLQSDLLPAAAFVLRRDGGNSLPKQW